MTCTGSSSGGKIGAGEKGRIDNSDCRECAGRALFLCPKMERSEQSECIGS